MPQYGTCAFAYHLINVIGVVCLVTWSDFCFHGGQARPAYSILTRDPSALGMLPG